jgi:hypothetical protein
MLFLSVVGDDQIEVAYMRVQNVSGSTRALGDVAVLDTATPNGVRVASPVAATLGLFVGCYTAITANLAYGLVQTWGYSSFVKVINDVTTAIAIGDTLIPVNGQVHLARSSVGDGKSGWAHSLEAVATNPVPAAALKKVFLRGM